MVFKWTDENSQTVFEKAVFAQAKNKLLSLAPAAAKTLSDQCEKMAKISKSFVVMDCPYDRSVPKIGVSDTASPYWQKSLIGLDDYILDTVLACKDGDVTPNALEIARRADRCLVVSTNSPNEASSNSWSTQK